MSGTDLPGPFRPNLLPEFPTADRCLTCHKIVKRDSGIVYCLDCFHRFRFDFDNYELITSHHLTNRPYTSCTCSYCDRDLIKSQLIRACTDCSKTYTKLVVYLRTKRLTALTTLYRVNVASNTIESLTKINE